MCSVVNSKPMVRSPSRSNDSFGARRPQWKSVTGARKSSRPIPGEHGVANASIQRAHCAGHDLVPVSRLPMTRS